ncbi:MAG: Holliday junction resolvase RuvX [Ignavibacterium sp.]|nr:Holliday junction resolvase RuvX [Ignavibacterium sp.]
MSSVVTESRIMAIDFGIKRIGIALSDSLKLFAYPHVTLTNDSSLFDELKKIIEVKQVEKIILGIPSESKESKTSVVKSIEKFKEELKSKTKVKVILWDESFTSSIAQQKIMESVTKKKKRQDKGMLDMYAAAVILQEYLDSIKTV